MAKSHDYYVSFSKAERSSYHSGYIITFEIGKPSVRHMVSTDKFTELEMAVRSLAADFGFPCSAYVRLANPKERKPAGFDKWYRALKVLDVPTEEAA